MQKKELVGVDVFLDWTKGSANDLGESLKKLGDDGLKLEMMSNRGVKVWPGGWLLAGRVGQGIGILADEPTGELDSATATAVFSLLRDLARAEGITIITCTHDRLVIELASRVEELADGHLVTGAHREVWDRIQQRERSPFAATPAEGMEEQPALSSLIGADLSQFKPASERVTHVAAEPHHEEEIIDNSPAHVLHEKRLHAEATANGDVHPGPGRPTDEEVIDFATADDEIDFTAKERDGDTARPSTIPPPSDDVTRWGRPRD